MSRFSSPVPPPRTEGRSTIAVVVGLLALAALLTVAVVILRRPESAGPAPPPRATVSPPTRRHPTSPPVPTSERPRLPGHRSVVLPWEGATPAEPTETPTAVPTFPVRPPATPTPRPSECVVVRWSASTMAAPLGQILVDIEASNRCGRDLEGIAVWFLVEGYRNGALVQSVRGHLFDPLRDGDDGHATIALPGSVDWYDRIEVRVLDPADL
jgi:hypothetical protein